eukprot:TRINITY_DN27812_c0_g1_i1.p1 TRINITY_DN27812_c0_g1~~TRINITY_DN27812_c0_g1_i1.p1  ORF type:complete len:209 (+),score=40.81 TRINITY_DN27812_c0_g1_i1:69-695(+)
MKVVYREVKAVVLVYDQILYKSEAKRSEEGEGYSLSIVVFVFGGVAALAVLGGCGTFIYSWTRQTLAEPSPELDQISQTPISKIEKLTPSSDSEAEEIEESHQGARSLLQPESLKALLEEPEQPEVLEQNQDIEDHLQRNLERIREYDSRKKESSGESALTDVPNQINDEAELTVEDVEEVTEPQPTIRPVHGAWRSGTRLNGRFEDT